MRHAAVAEQSVSFEDEQSEPELSASVVVACKDCGNLLDSITAALRKVSKRISDADVMTNAAGIALDRFEIEHSGTAESQSVQ